MQILLLAIYEAYSSWPACTRKGDGRNLVHPGAFNTGAIARLIEVSPNAVLKWIKAFEKTHYEKPAPGDAILVEFDEMWHYVKSKKTSYGYGKPIVERLENSSTGSVEEGIKQRYQN